MNIFSDLHEYSARAKFDEPFAEMMHGEAGAEKEIACNQRQQDKDVHKPEPQQVQPREPAPPKVVLLDQWTLKFEAALESGCDGEAKNDLRRRDDDPGPLCRAIEVN